MLRLFLNKNGIAGEAFHQNNTLYKSFVNWNYTYECHRKTIWSCSIVALYFLQESLQKRVILLMDYSLVVLMPALRI